MFQPAVQENPVSLNAKVPADLFEGDTMLDPKWFVIGVALGAAALAANYDMGLGMAAGVVLAILGGIYLWVRINLAIGQGQPGSNRAQLARRIQTLGNNRREAQAKELGAQSRSERAKRT